MMAEEVTHEDYFVYKAEFIVEEISIDEIDRVESFGARLISRAICRRVMGLRQNAPRDRGVVVRTRRVLVSNGTNAMELLVTGRERRRACSARHRFILEVSVQKVLLHAWEK